MVDVTALRRQTGVQLCLDCGKCSALCPLAGFDGFSAAGVVTIRDDGARLARLAVPVQRCLTCGYCELRCPQGVHFTDFVMGLRAGLSDDLAAPCPHGQVLQTAARLEIDAAGSRDLSWLDDDLAVAEKGEIALFVGCLPLFDALFESTLGVRTLDIARAAIRALNGLGIEPVLVAEERCCGHDLLWSGDRDGFVAHAEANAASFRERGVERILTTCAECCRTWRLDYPDAVPEYRPKVEHIVEFLDERLGTGDLHFGTEPEEAVVTYQDPCRLGRQLGVVEAPRHLLDSLPGVDLVEMSRCGWEAACCGTAGFLHCDADSRRLQAERLGEAGATGAETLLTACPKCLVHFACAQAEDRRRGRSSPPIEVQDFTVFTAARLAAATSPEARERTETLT